MRIFAEGKAQRQAQGSSHSATSAADRRGNLILRLQKEAGNQAVQRVFSDKACRPSQVPQSVHHALKLSGQPLDAATATFMGSRFGHDFSHVRVHTDSLASDSATAVGARAYTVGSDIVFADGQFAPRTSDGQKLLAHELAHVVQQGTRGEIEPRRIGSPSNDLENAADRASEAAQQSDAPRSGEVSAGLKAAPGTLQRTPASKVDCASTAPLHLPNGGQIDDPVGVITAAEQRAKQLLDEAISALDSTRQQILSGSPAGWPTVSDALGFALELLGLDPNNERVWKGTGSGTVALLLLRLRWVRNQIGSGSFFFTCLGPVRDEAGGFFCGSKTVTETEVHVQEQAIARTGGFHIYLCEMFWDPEQSGHPDPSESEDRALVLIHESMHTFADFIQDERTQGMHVAGCYERFVAIAGGSRSKELESLAGLCPSP